MKKEILLCLFLIVLMSGVGSAEKIYSVENKYLSDDYFEGEGEKMLVSETTSGEEYYLESGEPTCPYPRWCYHYGSIHYWDNFQKVYVGNFSIFHYWGAELWLAAPDDLLGDLHVARAYGAINFTINEDYYEGILGGISIKDFRRWDINDSFDYLIMNRSLRYDPLYWEIGYTFFEELTKNGNEKVDGKIILVSAFDGTDPPKYYYEHGLYLEENTYEQRISSLESWRTTINDWKDTITNTLSNITDSITSLFTTTEDHEDSIDDHETRIVTLETQTPPDFNLSFSEYWKYLDFRTKEDIACGWGEDNELNLFKMQDLGASCEIDGGRCNCKEVNGECDIEEPLYCYSWELRRNDINLEIKNLAGEDLTIESIDVTNCGIYDRDYKLREGRDRTFRISCADDSFTGGDVTIQYKTESGESLSSTGIVVI